MSLALQILAAVVVVAAVVAAGAGIALIVASDINRKDPW